VAKKCVVFFMASTTKMTAEKLLNTPARIKTARVTKNQKMEFFVMDTITL
jgi:hypothetical protein